MSNMNSFNLFFQAFSCHKGFNDEEKKLSSLIYTSAKEEVGSYSWKDYSEDLNPNRLGNKHDKIEIALKNFEIILNLFREAPDKRKKFMKNFPQWSPQRQLTIADLLKLADSIAKDRHASNRTRTFGSLYGISGGLLLAASLACPPLGVLGATLSLIGGATVIGSSVTETTFLNGCLKDGKNIFEKDQDNFKVMGEWFKHSQEIIDVIENLIGFDVAQQIYKKLGELKTDLNTLSSLRGGKLHLALKELIKFSVMALAASGSVAAACVNPHLLIPAIVAFFIVIVCLRKNHNFIFNSVLICHHTVFALMNPLECLGIEIGKFICKSAVRAGAVNGAGLVSKATAKMVAYGTFAAFGIALDAANLIITLNDMGKEDESEHVVKIKKVVKLLTMEKEVLSAVYDKLAKEN